MKNKSLVDNILKSYQEIGGINHLDGSFHPSKKNIEIILKLVKEILFPGFFEKEILSNKNLKQIIINKLEKLQNLFKTELDKTFCWVCEKNKICDYDIHCSNKAKKITNKFLNYIPNLRLILKKDISAIYNGDPAAKSEEEIILSYPGFSAITTYRIANYLFRQNLPLIPRLMTEISHSETGIDIHPSATIGEYFCIDHGTGIVIGETAEIGDHVKLYQGVTIGALSVPERNCTEKRHPTIKSNVTIYARTTILGGKTIIGENSIIGGNSWIIKSVPANSKVYFACENKIQTYKLLKK